MDNFTLELSMKIVRIILQGPPIPSLVYASAASILVEQWNIISEKTSDCSFDCERCFYYSVIEEIRKIIDSLPIPDPFRRILYSISIHMTLEINIWSRFVKRHYGHSRLLSGVFERGIYWSKLANVDYFKTAESLIFCTDLDYEHRYKLACLCCIKSAVLEISSILEKQNGEDWGNCYNHQTVDHVIIYWTSNVIHQKDVINRLVNDFNRDRNNRVSELEYLLLYARGTHNVYAVKYFSEKLKQTMVKDSLEEAAAIEINRGNLNMMCFFMSQMDKEQQLSFFMEQMEDILLLLYHDIEWQSVFMAIIYPLLPHIPEDVFCGLVKKIRHFITNTSCKSNENGVMLKDMILAAPVHLKVCLFHCDNLHTFLIELFKEMGIQFVKMLLDKNALSNLSESIYCKLLIAIAKNSLKNHIASKNWQDLFCELWDYAPSSVLQFIVRNVMISRPLTKLLLQMKDLKRLKELVSSASSNEIKKTFCSLVIIRHIGYEILEKNMFQSIALVEQALRNKDLKVFKQVFFNRKAFHVCISLVIQGAYDTAEKVINWCSTEIDILKIKEQIAYKIRYNVASSVKQWSLDLTGVKIPDLNRMLPWCFPSAEKVVVNFSLQQEEFHVLLKRISMCCEANVSVEEIIEWWYFGDQEAISKFKYDLVYGESKELCMVLVLFLVASHKTKSQLIRVSNFVQWCFNIETKEKMDYDICKCKRRREDYDICKYKRKLLHDSIEGNFTICESMLRLHMFTRANEFVTWCLENSDKEIQQFKYELFLQDKIVSIFEDNEFYKDQFIS